MDRLRATDGLALLLLWLAPLLAQTLGAPYLITPIITVAAVATAALSLDLLLTVSGFVSFGHAAFFALGGYVVGIGSFHAFDGSPSPLFGLPGWNDLALSLPLSAAAGAALATLFGLVCLRSRGAYFIMATLALAQLLFYALTALEGYGGDDGLSLWWGRNRLFGWDLSQDLHFAYVAIACCTLMLLFLVALANAPFGWVLQGGRENEARMRALGYRLYPYRLAAFALSGAMGAVAGALRVNATGYLSPNLASWQFSGELLVILVFGGLRRPSAALWGAGVLVALEYHLSQLFPYWRILLGPLLIVAVLLGRQGIAGLVQRGVDRLIDRRAAP